MTHILHLDASARPGLAGKDLHGSHSRNLSHRFISQWQARRPQDVVTYATSARTRPRSSAMTGSPHPSRPRRNAMPGCTTPWPKAIVWWMN